MCVCVCVQLPRADRLLRFSIENTSKRLDYPTVVYRGAILVLLLVLLSDRKVACRSQRGETRANQEAIDGCRLRVGSKAYSASSYKHGTCVGVWRDRAANVLGKRELMHLPRKPATVFKTAKHGVVWERVCSFNAKRSYSDEHSSSRTQTNTRHSERTYAQPN